MQLLNENEVLRSGGIAAGLIVLTLCAALATNTLNSFDSQVTDQPAAAVVGSPFVYSFNTKEVLHETGSEEESTSPYWWVDSGGELIMDNGVGKTMQGVASPADPWRMEYEHSNPTDSDKGLHPQNIFRLVTRSAWDNVSEQAGFNIVKDNFSDSPNRNASNGLLFFIRYKDSETLYYVGIRVDGTAVIKKKYEGTYYTMAQKKVFPGVYEGSIDEKT